MTSRSERVSVRLTHRQAELLRALAYQFQNTPTSLAAVYVLGGMDTAIRRGAQLAGLDEDAYRQEVMDELRAARAMGWVAKESPNPDPEPAF